jgi:hypothetical protein
MSGVPLKPLSMSVRSKRHLERKRHDLEREARDLERLLAANSRGAGDPAPTDEQFAEETYRRQRLAEIEAELAQLNQEGGQ